MIKDPYGGWMFDLDEREALTDILKAKFNSKQIDTFLELLQFICFQMKIWNEELLSYQDIKGYADPILNSIKNTTDYLSPVVIRKNHQVVQVLIGNSLPSRLTAMYNSFHQMLEALSWKMRMITAVPPSCPLEI